MGGSAGVGWARGIRDVRRQIRLGHPVVDREGVRIHGQIVRPAIDIVLDRILMPCISRRIASERNRARPTPSEPFPSGLD